MAMELENWICDMANGDKEGLRQFYEETARSVYSFIFSVLKDPHESEDVMQETFLAVWEHAGDYVPYGKPLAWVFTIARRLCYMRLREKKRQETLEETGVNPFQTDLSSTLTQLSVEQDFLTGGNDNIFGETKESCLAAINKILERIENPLATMTEERTA